jgi:hypothetical protein
MWTAVGGAFIKPLFGSLTPFIIGAIYVTVVATLWHPCMRLMLELRWY